MNRQVFWNDAAKWGLLIGVVMGGSRVLEYGLMLSGSVTYFMLLTLEWAIVGVLYAVLLYRAVLLRAVQVHDEHGFSFGYCLNYALVVSMFASVIVSALSVVYINSIAGGYSLYVEQLAASITTVMADAQVDSSVVDSYMEGLDNMQDVSPTLFDTFLSTLSTYILAGTFVGTIVSLFVKRYIKRDIEVKENIKKDE